MSEATGIWNLLMQVPVTGIFVAYMIWLRGKEIDREKRETAERLAREEIFRKQWEDREEKVGARLGKIMNDHAEAMSKVEARLGETADNLQRLAVIVMFQTNSISSKKQMMRQLHAMGHKTDDLAGALDDD